MPFRKYDKRRVAQKMHRENDERETQQITESGGERNWIWRREPNWRHHRRERHQQKTAESELAFIQIWYRFTHILITLPRFIFLTLIPLSLTSLVVIARAFCCRTKSI